MMDRIPDEQVSFKDNKRTQICNPVLYNGAVNFAGTNRIGAWRGGAYRPHGPWRINDLRPTFIGGKDEASGPGKCHYRAWQMAYRY